MPESKLWSGKGLRIRIGPQTRFRRCLLLSDSCCGGRDGQEAAIGPENRSCASGAWDRKRHPPRARKGRRRNTPSAGDSARSSQWRHGLVTVAGNGYGTEKKKDDWSVSRGSFTLRRESQGILSTRLHSDSSHRREPVRGTESKTEAGSPVHGQDRSSARRSRKVTQGRKIQSRNVSRVPDCRAAKRFAGGSGA